MIQPLYFCALLFAYALGEDKNSQGKSSISPPAVVKTDHKPMPDTAKPMEVTVDSLDMDVIDYIRSGALILAFVAALFAGRSVWLKSTTLIAATMGTALYFFPKALLDYQVIGFDSFLYYFVFIAFVILLQIVPKV